MKTPISKLVAAIGELTELAAHHSTLRSLPWMLLHQCNLIDVASAEVLARLGSAPKWAHFVVRGELRLLRYLPNGNEAVMQRAHHGFIAEASFESEKYHCHVVAAQASRVLRIPIEPFREALRSNQSLRSEWTQRLTREVMRLRAHSERLSLNSAADRIAHFIELEGSNRRITLRGTKKMWAAELGLSHEVL